MRSQPLPSRPGWWCRSLLPLVSVVTILVCRAAGPGAGFCGLFRRGHLLLCLGFLLSPCVFIASVLAPPLCRAVFDFLGGSHVFLAAFVSTPLHVFSWPPLFSPASLELSNQLQHLYAAQACLQAATSELLPAKQWWCYLTGPYLRREATESGTLTFKIRILV